MLPIMKDWSLEEQGKTWVVLKRTNRLVLWEKKLQQPNIANPGVFSKIPFRVTWLKVGVKLWGHFWNMCRYGYPKIISFYVIIHVLCVADSTLKSLLCTVQEWEMKLICT
jgi:hypothetical protein